MSYNLFIIILNFLLFGAGLEAQETGLANLRPNELLSIGATSFKFKEVISDSRCPQDVTCIWAGEAKVLMEIYENGKLCGEEVITISGIAQTLTLLNKWFPNQDLLVMGSLQPYPKTGIAIAAGNYRLRLQVTPRDVKQD